MTDSVALRWLEDSPAIPTGVRWGVPWEAGVLSRDDTIEARDGTGAVVPVQSWPTAYWPDGSVKWTGHAASFDADAPDELEISRENDESKTDEEKSIDERSTETLVTEETDEYVEIDTGQIVCRINRRGAPVIREVSRDGHTICTDGSLVCIRESRREESGRRIYEEERFEGRVDDVTIERAGEIHAVLKVEGTHVRADEHGGDRSWLPFTLYLSFDAGSHAIRATHTFVFDGEPERDFITGLGFTIDVPMSGPEYNRHVRFSGDDGVFREPARLLPPRYIDVDPDLYERHVAGESLDPRTDGDDDWANLIEDMTPWDDFKLVQNSPDHYVIQKRAGKKYRWIDAAHGDRSSGLAFAGDSGGGVAVGLEDFWEKYPSSLGVTDVLEDEAAVQAWFWSPDGEPMDLRQYDEPGRNTNGAAYGGLDEERSTPYGIANTSELTLFCFDGVPDQRTLQDCADETQSPSLLVCDPEHYHDVNAFGNWSLENRETPERAWLEAQLDGAIEFYRDEIERRRWYGFWDYGDIMHSYDPVRHQWRYDVGGYAWQNTEQVPTMWFWYAFLRSGRADIFRMAEAQTRHTSDVDVYHEGPLAGLGTRHNVLHWGGSCKEARISMAGHHRFYYYLTGGDERLGDVFREVRDADFATLELDPMRNHIEDDDHPTHARIAPEWLSYSANWMTEWERFESEAYREKILTGIECIEDMPLRMFSGSTFGYDPETGELSHIGDGNYGYTFLHCMGGPQLWPELAELIDDDEWEEMLAETGLLYVDREERTDRLPDEVASKLDKLTMYAANMGGFAADHWDDDRLAEMSWELLLDEERRRVHLPMETRTVEDEYLHPVEELPAVKTNIVSIWSLNVIACLEYIGDQLPARRSDDD
ncbi:hypothetical protein [Natronoglomus mannanivorans]|uniref:Uncharacterized protein n=1 Tax=Natronoglomus mannanivorans TaxID=2979990 RepID=A0AAP2Z0W7_9EURY|nr:hypothetical protein [Halobacteria archaeon AArc-xg1-1]